MFKFSKGQMVEVIDNTSSHYGGRFNVTDRGVSDILNKVGKVLIGEVCYISPWFSVHSKTELGWCREDQLKLINPDGDTLSEDSFEGLLLNLKQGITV